MKKAVLMVIVLVFLVGSLFALAEQQEQEEQPGGFWCTVGKLFTGERKEAVVGKAA